MLSVKYYKDYRHNYLIIKDNGNLSENAYQRKMVTENKIKGLLVSQERYINGEILLYYEITSKQSLFSIMDGKRIGMESLREFFIQLKTVNDCLQKYLLDGSCLILQPEYIFQNIETGQYFFVYFPDQEEGKFSQLLEFFISRVDNEDTNAVEAVYKIADLMNRDQFVLDEILKWFQDDVTDMDKKNDTIMPHQETRYNNEYPDYIDNEQINNNPDIHIGKRISELKWKKMIPFWIAGVLGAGILIYINWNYPLAYQEYLYFIIGWIMVGVLMVGPMIWLLLENFSNNNTEKVEKEKIYYYADTNENETVSPMEELGNTVYIPWTESCENKLYSLDRKNKCHIELGTLPLTVGKLAGAVDMVINEKSISRMHAKFTRSGKNICITDLNSTNGTFRNGMRLVPNTSEIIEPGDEIRLGKLKFIYR